MIEKWWPEILTSFPNLYDLSVLRNPLSNTKIVKFVIFVAWIFWIITVCMIRSMLQLKFMIEKPRSDVLTLSTTYYDLSISHNLLSMAEIRHFGASGTGGWFINLYFHFIFDFCQHYKVSPLIIYTDTLGRGGKQEQCALSLPDFVSKAKGFLITYKIC